MTVVAFRKPARRVEYRPDPRNGEVYATDCYRSRYVEGQEIEQFDSFAVVHMSRSGDSASMDTGYPSMTDAIVAALAKAKALNAVFLSDRGGTR